MYAVLLTVNGTLCEGISGLCDDVERGFRELAGKEPENVQFLSTDRTDHLIEEVQELLDYSATEALDWLKMIK